MCTLQYYFFASRGRAILPEKRRLRKIIMYERKKTYFWEAVRPTVPARYHTSSDRNMRPRYLLRGQEIPVSRIPKILFKKKIIKIFVIGTARAGRRAAYPW